MILLVPDQPCMTLWTGPPYRIALAQTLLWDVCCDWLTQSDFTKLVKVRLGDI